MPSAVSQAPSASSKPVTLANINAQLTKWRATRLKGARIPPALWEGIRALSFHYDCDFLASALDIEPRRLRVKMETEWKIYTNAPSTQALPVTAMPDFVELPIRFASPVSAEAQSLTQQAAPSSLCTLELIRPDGTTLKASGLAHQEILSLTQGFLSQ